MNHSKMFWAKHGGGGGSFKTEADKKREKEKREREIQRIQENNDKIIAKVGKIESALHVLKNTLPKLKLQVESANAHMTNGTTSIASTYGDSVYSYAGVIAEKADALSYAYTAHYIDLDSDINQISAKIIELENRIVELEKGIVLL